MNGNFWKSIFLFLLLCSVDVTGKRGGGGGFGRSGGFGSRGSSAARASSSKSGGGWFGGGSKSTGTGTHSGGVAQPNYGRSGTGSGTGGGFFGSKTGSGGGGYRTSSFSGSGIGSRSRSDTFKNMIVGAAAGYLTYQAGKAIIRSMTTPMMWNGRNYYWGQQYYPGGYASGRTMCRMPIESESRFADVYTPEGSRPKEIVWSCNYNEQCCGYECCPSTHGYGGGYQQGYWNSGRGIGIGTIILLLLICCCGAFVVKRFFDQRRQNNEHAFVQMNKEGYQPGHANYTTSTAPDGPPPYPATASGGYPPENGFRYPPA